MMMFLKRWMINTVAVLAAAHIVSGISYDKEDWVGLLVATLILGILNTFIRPILVILALPLLLVTLGLFMIVINACLLLLTGKLIDTFHVESFGAAFLGALVISLISMVLNALTGSSQTRVEIKRGRRRPDQDDSGKGGGSVIDV